MVAQTRMPKQTELELLFWARQTEWHRYWTEQHDRHSYNELCHYTDASGLEGILRSRRSWATHIDYLNDRAELRYAHSLIRERIREREQARKGTALEPYLHDTLELFSLFDEHLDVYVACFCESDDLLSQWRAYGAAGGGYAVCISPKLVEGATYTGSPPKIYLRRVLYDQTEQIDFLEAALDAACHALLDAQEKYPDSAAKSLAILFHGTIRVLMLDCLWCFKSSVFSEEREWRFGYVCRRGDLSDVQFRTSRGNIIPYVPLDLSRLATKDRATIAINKIVHGPTLEPKLAKQSLEWLAAKLEYKNIEIAGSKVPLRL